MTEHQNIIYPMFILALLPAIVLIFLFYYRVKSVLDGDVGVQHFATHTVEGVAAMQVKLTHNLANQFEFPVLFYTVSLLALNLHTVDKWQIVFSWSYVACRYIHSLIHITYNKVVHRLTVFFISNVFLIILWFRLVLQI